MSGNWFEGVVLVGVVARRLRGHQRGLLHGNSDDGERSVGGSNATQQHNEVFVQSKERSNGISAKKLEGSDASHFLVIPLVDAGAGERWREEQRRRCSWLRIRPDGGIGEAGWAANNNVTRLGLGRMRDRLLALLCAAGGAAFAGCAINPLRVSFTQQAAALLRQQWQ
ncbi:hypothetical protein N431DRAFT_460990 [Stipitochalara longipes BDJ]|nr:hypothetical protein N431DRAFT_460990 [Stipitochalara longipes BDJ]